MCVLNRVFIFIPNAFIFRMEILVYPKVFLTLNKILPRSKLNTQKVEKMFIPQIQKRNVQKHKSPE